MEFVGIIGDPGSGKTCLMTALLVQDSYYGRLTFGTYTVNIARHQTCTFEQICDYAEQEGILTNASIAFDEMSIGGDAYAFLEATPRKMKVLVSQLRHDMAIAYYTCQNFRQITAPLRRATGGFLMMFDRDAKVNPGPYHWKTCGGLFDVTVLDQDMREIRKVTFDGKPWYRYYNTRQKVKA